MFLNKLWNNLKNNYTSYNLKFNSLWVDTYCNIIIFLNINIELFNLFTINTSNVPCMEKNIIKNYIKYFKSYCIFIFEKSKKLTTNSLKK